MTRAAATAAVDKLGTDRVAYDVSEQLAITDVFLVVTASNERQVGAVVEGIEESLRVTAGASDDDEKLRSALALARRRRLGPFASQPLDRENFRRAMAAMLRAGHDPNTARRALSMAREEAEEFV